MHDLEEIARRTRRLMDELGLRHTGATLGDLGWSFAFDRARTRLGLCTWRRGRHGVKRISLSGPLAGRLGWVVMEDVARHEIAHALDYESRGRSAHDARWKRWAVVCGADPSATYEGPLGDDPSSRFVATCQEPGCTYRRPLYRVPLRTLLCADCRRDGRRRVLRVQVRATGADASWGPDVARWVGTCPSCAGRVGFSRRPAGLRACAACCAGRGFDARYVLRLARRKASVVSSPS